MTSEANTQQYGGTHYKNLKVEVWDFITANNIPYMEGNIIRYATRWRDKGGMEDLLKLRHYVDKLIEVEMSKSKEERGKQIGHLPGNVIFVDNSCNNPNAAASAINHPQPILPQGKFRIDKIKPVDPTFREDKGAGVE